MYQLQELQGKPKTMGEKGEGAPAMCISPVLFVFPKAHLLLIYVPAPDTSGVGMGWVQQPRAAAVGVHKPQVPPSLHPSFAFGIIRGRERQPTYHSS